MIDHKNKFIFIHIPKNAGSSINKIIKHSNATARMTINMHVPCTAQREHCAATFDSFFKFSFVRNPWDRLYSLYKFNTRRAGRTVPFDEWVFEDQFTMASELQTPRVSIRKKPQVDWLCDAEGNLMVDFVGRFETLAEDFSKIKDKLNITNDLEKINTTDSRSYIDAYNDITYNFVEEHFAKDIEMFDYKF